MLKPKLNEENLWLSKKSFTRLYIMRTPCKKRNVLTVNNLSRLIFIAIGILIVVSMNLDIIMMIIENHANNDVTIKLSCKICLKNSNIRLTLFKNTNFLFVNKIFYLKFAMYHYRQFVLREFLRKFSMT